MLAHSMMQKNSLDKQMVLKSSGSGDQPFLPVGQTDGAQTLWGLDADGGPNLAMLGGRGHDLALSLPCGVEGGRAQGMAWPWAYCMGLWNLVAGDSGSIDCHCSPATKSPDPYEVLWAGCHISEGCIWPADLRLSTPVLGRHFQKYL